jgi:hypothetical protein
VAHWGLKNVDKSYTRKKYLCITRLVADHCGCVLIDGQRREPARALVGCAEECE